MDSSQSAQPQDEPIVASKGHNLQSSISNRKRASHPAPAWLAPPANDDDEPDDPPPSAPSGAARVFEPEKVIAAWHTRDIPKGVYGDLSKVLEEVAEAEDAIEQRQLIMLLIELSDIVGAAGGVAEKHFGLTLDDLVRFAKKRSAIAQAEVADSGEAHQ